MRCPNCTSLNIINDAKLPFGSMQLNRYECFDCQSKFYNIEAFLFMNIEMKQDDSIQEILNYLDWNWKRLRNNDSNWPIPVKELIEKKQDGFGRKELHFRQNMAKTLKKKEE